MSLFVDADAETMMQELLSKFEEETGEVLNAGDQRRIFLQGVAYALAVFLNDLEETGKQNLLRYATGDALDAIGELIGITRAEAKGAECTLQFNLSAVQANDVYIPAGTRVTPDGKLFFATDDDLVIAAGTQAGTSTATCTTTGDDGNGFVAGQIDTLVDGIAYVQSVENTEESHDGADSETDDDFRERIREAPASYSTCGSELAYEYWARTASDDVGDVAIDSPSAATIRIAVVKTDGIIPETTDPVIAAVSDACSAEDRRPMTDLVNVVPATAVSTSVDMTYYVSDEDIGQLDEIKDAVAAAVAEYKVWQTTSIGKDINPDYLRKLVLNAGASRCVITAPVYTEVSKPNVAQFTAAADSVTFGGMSE